MAKPNAPAPHREHWYYRIDRDGKRQCWYLAPQGIRVQKNATEALKPDASDTPKTIAERSRVPQAPTTEPAVATTVSDGFAPAAPPVWPQAARFSDAQPSSLQLSPANEPRSPDAIDPALRSATDRAEAPQAAANARTATAAEAAVVVDGDHTFSLVMLATALLITAGSVLHATRRRHRRKFSGYRELRSSLSTLSTCCPAAATAHNFDLEDAVPPPPGPRVQREDVVEILQRLLAEMQTRQYAREGASRGGHLA